MEGEVVAVRRVSRIQKEDELLQKAMRKKSRKVVGVIMKLRVDFRLKLYKLLCTPSTPENLSGKSRKSVLKYNENYTENSN